MKSSKNRKARFYLVGRVGNEVLEDIVRPLDVVDLHLVRGLVGSNPDVADLLVNEEYLVPLKV